MRCACLQPDAVGAVLHLPHLQHAVALGLQNRNERSRSASWMLASSKACSRAQAQTAAIQQAMQQHHLANWLLSCRKPCFPHTPGSSSTKHTGCFLAANNPLDKPGSSGPDPQGSAAAQPPVSPRALHPAHTREHQAPLALRHRQWELSACSQASPAISVCAAAHVQEKLADRSLQRRSPA